jgi:hypothetical protein
VFGDFLDAADKHLKAAMAVGGPQLADLPAVVPALHRLVTVLSRSIEDLAPCDEVEAAGRTDLQALERAILDAGHALRTAADCLHRSGAEADPRSSRPARQPPRARHLADAAAALAAGRDLLHTNIVLGPDGLVRDRSGWAPAVVSVPVMRALANEIAAWSERLAPFTVWLAGPAMPHGPRSLTHHPSAGSPRGGLINASRWLRTAGAALRPALDADPVRPADAELLRAIPAAVPPPRQPLGTSAESIAGLCRGITISASRLRAAADRGQDRAGWSPDLTSGGWQWIAQAAAVTSHLTELALRSLATRAAQLAGAPVTEARLHAAADSMTGMRAAWQQVDLMWNSIITEQRSPPTLAMSEASDLLLRMGRLVWDYPQWTPARAHRAPRRSPAALAPTAPKFTAVVSAAHQATDALARVAVTDSAAVTAAAQYGRLYVPTRSLPARYDIPRAFAPALSDMVAELHEAYQGAADASIRATRELDELAVAAGAPSRALALARAAALVPSRCRWGYGPPPGDDGHRDARLAAASLAHSYVTTGLPGSVQRVVRDLPVHDPVMLLRAAAIDNATRHLINAAASTRPAAPDAVQLAAQNFPHDPLARQSANTTCRPNSRRGSPPSARSHLGTD